MIVKLDEVKGVGPTLLHQFNKQNIWSTYDLVLHYPRGYEDFTVRSLSLAKNMEKLTVQGVVISKLIENPFGKVHVTTFKIKVMNEIIEVVAFNRKYLIKQLSENMNVIVKGVYHLYQHKIIASYVAKVNGQMPIKPIYKIDEVYDRTIQNLVKKIFDEDQVDIFENIPNEFVKKNHLSSRRDAYKMLHLPEHFSDIEKAERRFKYEEAFFLQLQLVAKERVRHKRPPKAYDLDKTKALIRDLPYELTADQKKATNDIFRDFKRNISSIRLLQGDVGSGKTIISLIAAYAVVTAKEQVALMAPTSLLAKQHYDLFKTILKNLNIALLSQKTKNKEAMKKAISHGEYDIIIGTHAVIESDVQFKNLGFVIIDEQHKFGVDARQTLIDKSYTKDVLYLTATPIPRTLAMVSFGESNVSTIKEKPSMRKPVITQLINQKDEQKAMKKIVETVAKNEHVFVVVPAISSDLQTDNINTVSKRLQTIDCPQFILHGQQSKDEQEDEMTLFKNTPGSIMLATSMIEVGIDIPSATLMVIFSAHQFGLAQLHQLRGRVGRGNLQSTCYLVSEKSDLERLELMTQTNDGFILSAYDLKARGPGDFIGTEQSGYLSFDFLDLASDYHILVIARNDVISLFNQPDFMINERYQYLRRHIEN